MAGIGASLEKVILAAAKGVAAVQIGVNKILWGSANTQPTASARYDTKTQKITYTISQTQSQVPKKDSLLNTGLFNILDLLISVDLCAITTYAFNNIKVTKNKRPPKEEWTGPQTTFYNFQDAALTVQVAIDKYTAFPSTFVGSFAGTGANPITEKQAIEGSGLPPGQTTISGTDIVKYNIYNLILYIKDIFATRIIRNTNTSAFTAEDQALIAEIPGLATNLNLLDDFLKGLGDYVDYTQITNEDLAKLQNKITKLRQVCVIIQTLDFRSIVALTGNFLNTNIQEQLQRLNKFLDPTKLLPTLKKVNDQILTFIRLARKLQNIINQSQFVIKLAILFIKILKFIQTFFLALPLPNLFITTGVNVALNKAHDAAKETNGFLIKLLKEINALLSIVLILVRYVLANTNELQIRLQKIIDSIELCEAFKDSDVLNQLKETNDALKSLRSDLEAYITQYDSKTNPDSSLFGKYNIKVIDEEITDPSVTNKRRRGVALDETGIIVTQSDLTFATNPTIIINEVKLKLMAAGLVSSVSQITIEDLEVISESIDYLNNNDILEDDLNIDLQESDDSPDNTDETKGLGLNAFINNLPGGKRLRKRTRKSLDTANTKLAEQLQGEKAKSNSALNTGQILATSVGTSEAKQENTKKPLTP